MTYREDVLYCRCGGEVRVVRLNADYLTLGHVNGGRSGHYVRLAPAARNGEGSPRPSPTGQPEAPASSRTLGASHPQTPRATRGLANGSAGSRVPPSRTSAAT